MSEAERLSEVLKGLIMNPNEFAKSLGFAQASIIYNILNGRNKISSKLVKQIIDVYPQINPDWLLYEKGEMLLWAKPGSNITEQLHEPSSQYKVCTACIAKDKEIADLKEIIQNQVKEWGTVCRDYRERSRRRDTG